MTIRCVSLLPRPLNFLFSALALLCASPAWAFGLNNIYGGQTLGKVRSMRAGWSSAH